MSLIDVTDRWVVPALAILAEWSLRWGILLFILFLWLAAKPRSRVATRYFFCSISLAVGMLLPFVPYWGSVRAPWAPEMTRVADLVPSPPIPRLGIFTTQHDNFIDHVPARPPRATAMAVTAERPRTLSRRGSLGAWRWTALVLSAAWAVGVLVLSTRLIGGRLLLWKFRREARAVGEASQKLLDECRRLMALTRPVALGTHAAVGSPVMIGGSEAIVLVPPDWDSWTETDRRTCLLHELAHLAHRDDLAKLTQEIVRIPFFFHPLVRWLTTRLDRERELLRDESVVARGADPVAYAQLLFNLGRRPGRLLSVTSTLRPGWLPFLDRGTVAIRIERLLEVDMKRTLSHSLKPLSTRGAFAQGAMTIVIATGIGGLGLRAVEPAATPIPAAAIVPETSAPKTRSFKGVVLSPDGRPVVGADVVVGFPGAKPPSRQVFSTDQDGRFAAPLPAESTFIDTYAFKQGFAPCEVSNWAPEGKEVNPCELRLGKPEAFRMILVDRGGKPVPGAEVRVTTLATEPVITNHPNGTTTTMVCFERVDWEVVNNTPLHAIYSAKSDTDGKVTLPALPAGDGLKFDAVAPGTDGVLRMMPAASGGSGSPAEPGFVFLADGQPSRVTLAPAAKVSGRVITRLPGVRVSGLSIFLQASRTANRPASEQTGEARTDEQGRFVIDGLDEGTANIMLSGHPPDGPWTYRAARDVPLRFGEPTDVTIELIRGVDVVGKVIDAESRAPLPDVGIGMHGPTRPQSGATVLTTKTDRKGNYRFRLPPGETFFYRFGPLEGYAYPPDQYGRTVTIPEGALYFDLPPMELVRAMTVRGRLFDAAGAPIAGAKVVGTCEGNLCRPLPGMEAITDEGGAFRLPEGLYNSVIKGQTARLLIRLREGTEHEVSTVPSDDGGVKITLARP